MKIKFTIIFLIFFINEIKSQEVINSIFIFTRCTGLKVEYIAKDFNIIDTLSTHVGIGLKVNNEYKIYNVSNDVKIQNSSLICENLESFINLEDIKYYSIWELNVNNIEMKMISEIFDEYNKLKIDFDFDFNIQNDNKFYCSEFVYDVLQKINSKKFYYIPLKKDLNQFYQRILNRSNLEYIPVDFFREMDLFKKIDESYLKK
jgi:hypothetical protein